MGRWSQARHRGRGNCVGRTFPLDAPSDTDWQWLNDGFTEGVASIVSGVCPVGANGWELAAQLAPIGNYDDAIFGIAPCSDPQIVGGFSSENELQAVIRWTLDDVPVSDWSTIKSTTIP